MITSWQWAKANPDAAARRIRALERENSELRADKERLDWLQKSTCWSHPPFGEDIRVAIDAARKEVAK